MSESFDFKSVTVKTVPTPANAQGRPRQHVENPFTEVLAASYEDAKAGRDSGRSLVIPAKAVGEAVYFIRHAADDLKIGARIILRLAGSGDPVTLAECKDGHPTRKVAVTFAGKDRKAPPKPKAKADESEAQATPTSA